MLHITTLHLKHGNIGHVLILQERFIIQSIILDSNQYIYIYIYMYRSHVGEHNVVPSGAFLEFLFI